MPAPEDSFAGTPPCGAGKTGAEAKSHEKSTQIAEQQSACFLLL